MKSWFLKRGYPEQMIDYKMEKVNFRENKKKIGINKKKRVPFVVTYYHKLNRILWFTPSPVISFRSSRKISSYIVRAKLYRESFKINRKVNFIDKCLVYLVTCKICNKHCTGQTTDSFRSRWNNYKSKSRNLIRMKVRDITVF